MHRSVFDTTADPRTAKTYAKREKKRAEDRILGLKVDGKQVEERLACYLAGSAGGQSGGKSA
jgi:hypothetical protein